MTKDRRQVHTRSQDLKEVSASDGYESQTGSGVCRIPWTYCREESADHLLDVLIHRSTTLSDDKYMHTMFRMRLQLPAKIS
ncbi:hypothetical protein BN2475_540038 [Paraburkholderia ribeironis]|uniref:Uncharacterized protein n=1 Tax=Paraburkholderia ribeironis TaxID=1247936 RepID=A0A1N7SD75_9BURK|nr:hypothetical protein BN2475_540038 [Paraburkholderia ribeironis]